MFGTLRIYGDALNEEDRLDYEAYYCGLCRTLRRKFGVKSQLILTYDCAFLALLLSAVYEDPETEKKTFCVEKMKQMRLVSTPSMDYAADMNLLLAYHNYSDRAHDAKKGKVYRIARSAVRTLKKDYEQVSKLYPRQKAAIETYMKDLYAYESAPDDNPDHAANLTGELMKEILDWKQDEFSKYLREIGFYLGKFIYLSDAFEDVEIDLASGDYNPFKAQFGQPDFNEKTENHLVTVMGECTRFFEMLPIFEHREILRNILYSGIWIPFFHAKKVREEAKDKAAGKE